MGLLVLKSGVRASEYESIVEPINGRITDEQIGLIHAWLTGIYRGPFAAALAVWQLREPQYWANLRMLGVKHLREQDALKSSLIHLRNSWRGSRGTTKTEVAVDVNSSSVPDGECDQPT